MTDKPYNPDYSGVFDTPVGPPLGGPQLTEHTGNRIATALERIADVLEHWLDEKSPVYKRPAYPLGDPAPSAGANGPTGPAT